MHFFRMGMIQQIMPLAQQALGMLSGKEGGGGKEGAGVDNRVDNKVEGMDNRVDNKVEVELLLLLVELVSQWQVLVALL